MWRWFCLFDILCLTSSSIIAAILKSNRELTSPYFYRTSKYSYGKRGNFPWRKTCCWQSIELWLRVSKVIFLFRHRFPLLTYTRLLRLCAWARDKNIFFPLTAVMTIYHTLFKGKKIFHLFAHVCEGRDWTARQADVAYSSPSAHPKGNTRSKIHCSAKSHPVSTSQSPRLFEQAC